jgi:two-component system, OmpR family, sensor histidine kinase ChvG
MDLKEPAEREKFLAAIMGDVSRMEHLLSEVREISQIDTRMDTEKTGVTDVKQIVLQVLEGYRLRKNAKNLAYEATLTDQEAPSCINPERLIQVLENLIDNAESFSGEGKRIRLDLSVIQDGIRLTVSDQGPGIPAEIMENIFNRFFSYRPEKDEKRVHTGLGLAIVKSIAEAYNGSIQAANRPEGGACFTLTLPPVPPAVLAKKGKTC